MLLAALCRSLKLSVERYQLHSIRPYFLKTGNSLCQTNSSLNTLKTLTVFSFLFVVLFFFLALFSSPASATLITASLRLTERAWCVWLNLESNLFSKERHSIIQSLQTAWVTVCFLLISMCLCVCVCVLCLVTLVSSFACVCLLWGTHLQMCVLMFMNAYTSVYVDIPVHSTLLRNPANQARWFSALIWNFQRSHQMSECALSQMGWLPS